MFFIPFPLVIAEIVIFFLAVQEWGFLNTLGFYLLPCLLGFFIVATVGRMAVMTLQSTVMRGQLPASRILHSGAIFLSGLLFLIPSFFARVLALILFLPGLRHIAVWRFKAYMAKQIAKGSANFNFGGSGGPFGFGMGNMGGGFRYYEYRNDGTGFDQAPEEREVYESNVLDVTPLKIVHEKKEDSGNNEG
ncbi:FxsA family protein [uncultured Bdellovibrio sp.]|uniref:FxsA family protein n=1 Tax=Bdellovibrio sp. HCB-162 TaxID=3394234 RepID=UPI0025E0EAB1|nr:FxsA family protein [uncultured Bdellovibrio sp.]